MASENRTGRVQESRLRDPRKRGQGGGEDGRGFHELWWTGVEAVFRNPRGDAFCYVF